jgi:predicted transcriptional regulator
MGELNTALRKVLTFIAKNGGATARELVEKLGIEPVNTASTRLVQLYEAGIVAREPYREPVRGGGRQFRYLPLVDGRFIEHGAWRSERTTVR